MMRHAVHQQYHQPKSIFILNTMQFFKPTSIWICFFVVFVLSACASHDKVLSQENIDAANEQCTQQVNLDRTLNVANWFTRWLECKRDKVMPFDIMVYPSKEKEIRAMYDKLIVLGFNVDKGIVPVQTVYKELDTMQRVIGMKQCLIRQVHADGSSDCVKR